MKKSKACRNITEENERKGFKKLRKKCYVIYEQPLRGVIYKLHNFGVYLSFSFLLSSKYFTVIPWTFWRVWKAWQTPNAILLCDVIYEEPLEGHNFERSKEKFLWTFLSFFIMKIFIFSMNICTFSMKIFHLQFPPNSPSKKSFIIFTTRKNSPNGEIHRKNSNIPRMQTRPLF